ncbi:hybrid sensor histidine kinase/response regulator transcription factor [Reichenbachiella versicolor]|uniref:hybrid sensor histidine kinase/response regulator transcription factor n=1 Tax=Reichenbachiella versicolor TaxID=1821036 RepID=UPI000D6EA2D9|nr:hybrid sensor histidine kinase/response regulator transcription factor [Reichenbachiella versicolor]
MIDKVKLGILSLFLLFFNVFAKAGNGVEKPTRYSMSDGLSHYGVTSILEDKNGYLWIGTYDGINRYDGYSFDVYRNNGRDQILTSNRVRSLYQDDEGDIWIGTDEGISIYRDNIQKFEVVYSNIDFKVSDSGPKVRQIRKFGQYVICATELEGILIFNEKTEQLVGRYIPAFEGKVFWVFDVLPLDDNTVLVSTTNGLYSFDFAKQQFDKILKEDINSHALSLSRSTDGRIYCSHPNGMVVFDVIKRDGRFKYENIVGRSFEEQISFSAIGKEGEIWIGTKYNGVLMFKNENELLNIEPKSRWGCEPVQQRLMKVSYILPTLSSGCWIGTFNEGIYNIKSKTTPFGYSGVRLSETDRTKQILHITSIDSTSIAIGVYFGNLSAFDIEKEELSFLPDRVRDNRFRFKGELLVKDQQGNYWKGTPSNGLFLLKPDMEIWKPIRHSDFPKLESITVRSVIIDRFGYTWLASIEGLYRFKTDDQGNILEIVNLNEVLGLQYPTNSEIKTILEDPRHDYVWVGSRLNGLFRLPLKNVLEVSLDEVLNLKHNKNDPTSLPNNFISSIARLPNDDLWIGMEQGGVCKVINFDSSQPTLVNISETDGLDNNVVKAILFDSKNNLWISTNKGLNMLNTSTMAVRSFSVEDGVNVSPFEYAAVKLDNGVMVFGGGNGICYFNPAEITDDVAIPKLIFGDLKIHNKVITVNDTINGRLILQSKLGVQKKLVFNHDENVISIELISLHFSNSQAHHLRYKLFPINKEWIETSSDFRQVNFNGLVPGKYKLEAQASNSAGKWGESRVVEIIIKPPYWKTTIAYILYVLLVLISAGVVIWFLLRMKSLSHKLEIEHLERVRVDELNTARIELFMNISHEFRTPLTLISGPLQVLFKMLSSNKDVGEHLELIQRQSKKMFQLVEQVHEYQKAEENHLKLHMSSFDFTELMIDVKQDFDHLADKSGKRLKFNGNPNQVFVMADKQKVEMILNNLLNNAFKFTEKGDTITVTYESNETGVSFKVQDTGKGIDDKDLPHIFERFYRSWKENTYAVGSGIGLEFSKKLVELHYGTISVESELGKGSIFSVMLPLQVTKEDAFNAKYIADILESENDFEQQKVNSDVLSLSENVIVDEELNELSIFYAEDNSDLRTFVSGVLDDYFNVVSFANGKQLMDAMEGEWPDLIISDILMPEMNGLEVCRAVKADVRTSHIPVLLLTSRSSIDDRVAGLELGADSYITKPFEMKHLFASAQMLLKNRQQLRDRFRIDVPIELEKKTNNQNDKVFIKKLYDLMEEHLDNEDLDLNIFIKELHFNRTHFYQKVKALTNHTPYELLKHYRLNKAAELLVQEGLSVSEVYIRTGFKSRTHFSRMFKSHYGVSPGKYGSEGVN